MMGISVWQLLIILLIVVMLFGTKRLRGRAPIWAARSAGSANR